MPRVVSSPRAVSLPVVAVPFGMGLVTHAVLVRAVSLNTGLAPERVGHCHASPAVLTRVSLGCGTGTHGRCGGCGRSRGEQAESQGDRGRGDE